jgi:AbrB family looped-hinge helix DNA binding protein
MARAVVRRGGRVTIPQEIRRLVGLGVGDALEVEVTEEGLLLRRSIEPDPSEWWRFTPRPDDRGQKGEEVRVFADLAEFEAVLNEVDSDQAI